MAAAERTRDEFPSPIQRMLGWVKRDTTQIDFQPKPTLMAQVGGQSKVGDLHADITIFLHHLSELGVIIVDSAAQKRILDQYGELLDLSIRIVYSAFGREDGIDEPVILPERPLEVFYEKVKELWDEIDKISFCEDPTRIFFTLLGDIKADRGVIDAFILLFLKKFVEKGVPFELIFSNHGAFFWRALIDGYKLSQPQQTPLGDFKTYYLPSDPKNPIQEMSMFLLGLIAANSDLSERMGQEMKFDPSPRGMVGFMKRYIVPHMKFVSYKIISGEIIIQTHAQVFADLFLQLAEELEIPFSGESIEELAQMVDSINEIIGKYLKEKIDESLRANSPNFFQLLTIAPYKLEFLAPVAEKSIIRLIHQFIWNRFPPALEERWCLILDQYPNIKRRVKFIYGHHGEVVAGFPREHAISLNTEPFSQEVPIFIIPGQAMVGLEDDAPDADKIGSCYWEAHATLSDWFNSFNYYLNLRVASELVPQIFLSRRFENYMNVEAEKVKEEVVDQEKVKSLIDILKLVCERFLMLSDGIKIIDEEVGLDEDEERLLCWRGKAREIRQEFAAIEGLLDIAVDREKTKLEKLEKVRKSIVSINQRFIERLKELSVNKDLDMNFADYFKQNPGDFAQCIEEYSKEMSGYQAKLLRLDSPGEYAYKKEFFTLHISEILKNLENLTDLESYFDSKLSIIELRIQNGNDACERIRSELKSVYEPYKRLVGLDSDKTRLLDDRVRREVLVGAVVAADGDDIDEEDEEVIPAGSRRGAEDIEEEDPKRAKRNLFGSFG